MSPAHAQPAFTAANAIVADVDDPAAAATNPAAAAFHDGVRGRIDVMVSAPRLEYRSPTGERSRGEGVGTAGGPFAGLAVPLRQGFTATLDVGTSFALDLRWPDDAFPVFAQTGVPFLAPTRTRLGVVAASPGLAWRPTPDFALALALNHYRSRRVAYDSVGIAIGGRGQGNGFTLAAIGRHGDFGFGAVYRSGPDIRMHGEVEGLPGPARADLRLPWAAQAGVSWQLRRDVTVEFDFERVGWGRFDEVAIYSTELDRMVTRNAIAAHDVDAWRLPLKWKLDEATRLRAGIAWLDNPQRKEGFSARTPGLVGRVAGFGLSRDFGDWTLDLAYQYRHMRRVRFDSEVPYVPGGDPNGTQAFAGDYSGSNHLLGLGVRHRF